jgi:hypothetical protein
MLANFTQQWKSISNIWKRIHGAIAIMRIDLKSGRDNNLIKKAFILIFRLCFHFINLLLKSIQLAISKNKR